MKKKVGILLKKSEKNSISPPKLNFSSEARQDLKSIQNYIAEEKESPKTALSVVVKILNRIEVLQGLPNSGTLLFPKLNFPSNYRYVRALSYLIFYRYENNEIFIDRIIHGKRNYIAILFPTTEEEF